MYTCVCVSTCAPNCLPPYFIDTLLNAHSTFFSLVACIICPAIMLLFCNFTGSLIFVSFSTAGSYFNCSQRFVMKHFDSSRWAHLSHCTSTLLFALIVRVVLLASKLVEFILKSSNFKPLLASTQGNMAPRRNGAYE